MSSDQIWKVKSFGNANIVYSNGGNKVLRVPKNKDVDIKLRLEIAKLLGSLLGTATVFDDATIVDLSLLKLDPIPAHQYGILLDDVTFGNTSSIEIKPKSGVIDVVDKEKGSNACLFCLYSRERDFKGDYCPFRLYENDFNVVKNGLLLLLENPQKHFQVITSQGVKRFSDFYQGCDRNEFIDNLANVIIHSNILIRLRAVQSTLNFPIYQIYQKYQENKSNISEPTSSDILRIINLGAVEEDVDKIYAYLMGKTMRDLSLIINFYDEMPARNTIKGKLKNSIFYSVDILDLDIKSVEKIEEYYNSAFKAVQKLSKGSSRYCQNIL
eukprot:NODE_405_length_7994_cov_0.788600.p3 type:complete len:326 gc:universal NODE_405_length_7994_cov_0.788600:1439-462(-)